MDWSVVAQGVVIALAGVAGLVVLVTQGSGSAPVALVPWAAILGGAWRAAAGIVRR